MYKWGQCIFVVVHASVISADVTGAYIFLLLPFDLVAAFVNS